MSTSSTTKTPVRLQILQRIGAVLLVAIVVRVGYLKVVWADYYQSLADKAGAGGRRPELPTPGAFLDDQLRPLAQSIPTYTVAVEPGKFCVVDRRKSEEKTAPAMTREDAARGLAAQLDIPSGPVLEAINDTKRKWRPVGFHMSQEIVSKVKAWAKVSKVEGLSYAQTWTREYPQKTVACHVVGVRREDHSPLDGLEKSYQFLIDGQNGTPRTNVDSSGRLIVGEEDAPVLPPVPGKNVVLSVDLDFQRAADEALDDCMRINQPTTATCTVFDVRTGEIKALASRPNYDPNAISQGTKDGSPVTVPSQEQQLIAPVVRVFEPGSTFKILTAAAVLDAGVADESTSYCCPGHEVIGGKPLKCWGKYAVQGHGPLNLTGMLSKSCNLFAAHLAMRLGAERFVAFLKNAGIGTSTRCGFPIEPSGKLHPAENLGVRDLANMGFGQTVMTTDVQLLAATAAVVNGGVLLQPHIVNRVLDSAGGLFRLYEPVSVRQVCSPETSARVRKMLRATVEEGTGKPARIAGLAVGGKTGTAQKWVSKPADPSNPDSKKEWSIGGYIMSFLLFLPVDSVPRYAILVTAEDPKQGQHGSDVAAPAARKVALAICRATGMLSEAQIMNAQSPASPG